MRRAKGSRISQNPGQIAYPARFDPGEFNIIAAYADAHDLSLNRALADLIRVAGKVITEPAAESNPPVVLLR